MADTVNSFRPLADSSVQNQRLGFQIQFSALQKTVVQRINSEIEDVIASADLKKRDRLLHDYEKISKGLPSLDQYLVANKNLLSQISSLTDETNALLETLGGDDNLTQDEVDAFQAKKSEVVQKLNNLYVLTHPDFVDTKEIARLKQNHIDALENLSPQVGTLSGDNAGLTDSIYSFLTDLSSANTTTQTVISTISNLKGNIEVKALSIQADIVDFDEVTMIKQQEEVDAIKEKYANILKAISLSFEGNAAFVESFHKQMSGMNRPEPGSVMNLFS